MAVFIRQVRKFMDLYIHHLGYVKDAMRAHMYHNL